ncbi:MAG: glycosyltransferase family 2 protein [Acidimicrobiales bacterium]
MTSARVGVVVSAYDRSSLLADLVAALQAQTVTDFEAVLVDNGSRDDTHEVLLRLTSGDSRFTVLRLEGNRGPARARNLAWRSIGAPWVAFTDDDCIPRPTWLEGLLAVAGEAQFIQGRTVARELPAWRRRGWFDRSQQIDQWSGRYETCNLLIARSVLEEHDGFNEQFRIAMGEDTDLGLRAVAGGTVTAFAPDGIAEHHVWPCTFGDYLRQRRRYAEVVELVRVRPAARGLLRWGFVLRGVHLVVWSLVPVAVASAIVGVWWPPVAVVAAWVGRNAYRTRDRPFGLAARVGYSALHFVAYVYETVWFAITSVRYRSLVV